MTHLKDKRSVKLLQYAERVWDITEGSEEERKAMAIVKTEDFFNRLGIKTRLSEHNVGQETIDTIIKRFTDKQLPSIGMIPDVKIEDAEKIFVDRL